MTSVPKNPAHGKCAPQDLVVIRQELLASEIRLAVAHAQVQQHGSAIETLEGAIGTLLAIWHRYALNAHEILLLVTQCDPHLAGTTLVQVRRALRTLTRWSVVTPVGTKHYRRYRWQPPAGTSDPGDG